MRELMSTRKIRSLLFFRPSIVALEEVGHALAQVDTCESLRIMVIFGLVAHLVKENLDANPLPKDAKYVHLDTILSVFDPLENLRHLALGRGHLLEPRALQQILSRLPYLEHLDLFYDNFFLNEASHPVCFDMLAVFTPKAHYLI